MDDERQYNFPQLIAGLPDTPNVDLPLMARIVRLMMMVLVVTMTMSMMMIMMMKILLCGTY